MRESLQHYLNPLHVYCRLRAVMSKKKALLVSREYEIILFRPLIRPMLSM